MSSNVAVYPSSSAPQLMSRSAPPPHLRAAAASLNSPAAPHTRLCVMEGTVVGGALKEAREGIIEGKELLD